MNRERWIFLLIIIILIGLQALYRCYLLPRAHYQNAVARGTYIAYAEYLQQYPRWSKRFAVAEVLEEKWDSIHGNLQKSAAVQSSIVLQEVVAVLDKRQEKRIAISAIPDHRIMDYEDFPEEQKVILDEVYQEISQLDSTNYPLPSESPPSSMHRFLEREGNGLFEELAAAALADKLNAIAQDSFLQVDILSDGDPDGADLHIAYGVDNDYEMGIPGILLYCELHEEHEGHPPDEAFLGYVLDFQVKGSFTINSKTVPFVYQPTGRAPNIQSIDEGYQYLYQSLRDTIRAHL